MKKQQAPVTAPPPRVLIAAASFPIIFGIAFIALWLAPQPPEQGSSPSVSSPQIASSPKVDSDRVLLGSSDTTYSLWLDKSKGCVYVKDLTNADLRRMNVNLSQFKDVVKQQTGARCVYLE